MQFWCSYIHSVTNHLFSNCQTYDSAEKNEWFSKFQLSQQSIVKWLQSRYHLHWYHIWLPLTVIEVFFGLLIVICNLLCQLPTSWLCQWQSQQGRLQIAMVSHSHLACLAKVTKVLLRLEGHLHISPYVAGAGCTYAASYRPSYTLPNLAITMPGSSMHHKLPSCWPASCKPPVTRLIIHSHRLTMAMGSAGIAFIK